MDNLETDAQNAFTTTAIEQHLALWKTTRSLLEIDDMLDAENMDTPERNHTKNQELWHRFKNLFTIFRAS